MRDQLERAAKYLTFLLLIIIGLFIILPGVTGGVRENEPVLASQVEATLSARDSMPSSQDQPVDQTPPDPDSALQSDPSGGISSDSLLPVQTGGVAGSSEQQALPRIEPGAARLLVPEEYPTIQEAINAADDGEIVLVSPGTYIENLELAGKNITLASHFLNTRDFSHIEQTIVDGGGKDFVVSVAEDVGPGTMITGLTFRNAEDGIIGFGEFTFTFNRVTEVVDGIDFEGGGGLVQNSRFDFNKDDGIDLDDASAVVIENNWIANNGDDGIEIRYHPYEGPKLFISILSNWISENGEDGIQLIDYEGMSSRSVLIQDNLLVDNAMAGIGSTSDGNTIEDYAGSSSVEPTYVFNNTFVGNDHAITGGHNFIALNNLFLDSSAIAVKNVDDASIVSHNLFWGNGVDSANSNVDLNTTFKLDPLLDPETYALLPESPAIDSGTGIFSWSNQLVMVLPEEGYIGSARDLGAFESSPRHRRTPLEPNSFYRQSPSFYGVDAELAPVLGDELPSLQTLLQDLIPATLIEVTDTSLFVPASPDPAGITYLPISDGLLAVDSEVNEWSFYTGENLFALNLDGQLLGSMPAFTFTKEPTGLEYNPADNHLFVSADDGKKVFELDPGIDGLYRSEDDIVTTIDTEAFDSGDPEGIAFDYQNRVLFVADGRSSQIYRISPGRNGRFEGVSPIGDDLVARFDTNTFGIRDPEGLAYDPHSGNLFVVGRPGEIMLEMTSEGQIVRLIDISEAAPVVPAAVTIAPASDDSTLMSIYIADRGIGIKNVPDSNDGRIYELSLPPVTPGNRPPVVNAVADLSNLGTGTAVLRSRITDDGVPAPNPLVPRESVWRQLSGPAPAILSSLNATDVTAQFSMTGKYVFRAIVTDGELASSDDVTVFVTEGIEEPATLARIETGADDAEERADGEMKPVSSGLELGFGGKNQRVGLRFAEVYVPRGATITHAYIQFQAREADSDPASFTIEGHDVGDSGAFTNQFRNLTFRPKTAAAVSWSPNPWILIGESGPNQQTPDIAAIIQEIVDRSDWVSGNALSIMFTGTGMRAAVAFEGDPRDAPVLHIDFQP